MSRVKYGDLRAYGDHVSGKRFVKAIEGCETKVSLTSSILFDQVCKGRWISCVHYFEVCS